MYTLRVLLSLILMPMEAHVPQGSSHVLRDILLLLLRPGHDKKLHPGYISVGNVHIGFEAQCHIYLQFFFLLILFMLVRSAY